jgi:hypothetical protein
LDADQNQNVKDTEDRPIPKISTCPHAMLRLMENSNTVPAEGKKSEKRQAGKAFLISAEKLQQAENNAEIQPGILPPLPAKPRLQ